MGRSIGLIVCTVAVVVGLGLAAPFATLGDWLTHGGEAERQQMARQNPALWDASAGDDLLTALSASRPFSEPGARGVLLFGNSQQYTASLPKGAALVTGAPAVSAAELLMSRVNAERPTAPYALFVGAAPNQTMPEALWQAIYWYRVRHISPAFLIVQSSFDSFRKTGIRAGYQTLLQAPAFAAALAQYISAGPQTPYDRVFSDAEKEFEDRRRLLAPTKWTLEGTLRGLLSHLPLFARRENYRAQLLGDLYQARVMLFHISPTTKRHITGAPFEENWTALRDLVRLARSNGTKVLIYNAPVNPNVKMFYPEEYQGYVSDLQALAATDCQGFADLSDAVPAEDWGFWIDAADPIHFDAKGHEVLAARLFEAFGATMQEAR